MHRGSQTDYSPHASPTSTHRWHPSQRAADSRTLQFWTFHGAFNNCNLLCGGRETGCFFRSFCFSFPVIFLRASLVVSLLCCHTHSDRLPAHDTPPSCSFFSSLSISSWSAPSESFSLAVWLVSLRAGLQLSDSIHLPHIFPPQTKKLWS